MCRAVRRQLFRQPIVAVDALKTPEIHQVPVVDG